MPIFYRTRSVRITHRSFRVCAPDRCSHRIGDLGPVWVVIPDRPPVLVRISCSGGSIAVALLFATGSDHAIGWVFAVFALGILATLPARRLSGPPPRYELVTMSGGTSVRLYSTADPTEFGQVRRALQRAIEWNEDAQRS